MEVRAAERIVTGYRKLHRTTSQSHYTTSEPGEKQEVKRAASSAALLEYIGVKKVFCVKSCYIMAQKAGADHSKRHFLEAGEKRRARHRSRQRQMPISSTPSPLRQEGLKH